MVCLSRGGTVFKKLFLDFSQDGGLSIRTWDVVGPTRIFVVQIGWILHGECWGSDSCQAVHLVERGRFKASCNSSTCIIQS